MLSDGDFEAKIFATFDERINQSFAESGLQERLVQLVRTRLSKIGWDASLDSQCKNILQDLEDAPLRVIEKKLEDYGTSIFPESIKAEIEEKIREFLDEFYEEHAEEVDRLINDFEDIEKEFGDIEELEDIERDYEDLDEYANSGESAE
ncbi:hypothetical protein G6F37_012619 [Rhizopus arrhizus]|nr:hypothetical protein G6F37_012619 [Rhizopus arrhizus]KAG1148770.1 hypothetical protein G6F38_003273 [Rhizopus arrhizus]